MPSNPLELSQETQVPPAAPTPILARINTADDVKALLLPDFKKLDDKLIFAVFDLIQLDRQLTADLVKNYDLKTDSFRVIQEGLAAIQKIILNQPK